MIVNKAFLTIVDNRGINGFPFAMQEFGGYYLTGVSDDSVKDRIKLGDTFFFIENDSLEGLLENKLRIYADARKTYEPATLGTGKEGSFRGFLEIDNTIYAWTEDGVAITNRENLKRFIWNKRNLTDTNIIKMVYYKEKNMFVICTRKNIFFSVDKCETFIKTNFESLAIRKSLNVTDVAVRKYDEIHTEIVVTTSNGIHYSRSTDAELTSATMSWSSSPKKSYSTQIISIPPVIPEGTATSIVTRTAKPTSPLSDTVNVVLWDDIGNRWLFGSDNGVFSSVDLNTFSHITQQQPPNTLGVVGGTATPTTIDSIEWMKTIRIVKNVDRFYFVVDDPVSITENGLYQLVNNNPSRINVFEYIKVTVPGTNDTVYEGSPRNNIKDVCFGFGISVVVLKNDNMLYSFDNFKSFLPRRPTDGYAGKTVQCVYKLTDRFIFGSKTGIFYSIEDKIRLSFLCVNMNGETRKTYGKVMKDSNLFEFTIALHDAQKMNNPILKRTLTFQNMKTQYVFVLMTGIDGGGKEYRLWYLFGKEKRYSEMREVATEFGVG